MALVEGAGFCRGKGLHAARLSHPGGAALPCIGRSCSSPLRVLLFSIFFVFSANPLFQFDLKLPAPTSNPGPLYSRIEFRVPCITTQLEFGSWHRLLPQCLSREVDRCIRSAALLCLCRRPPKLAPHVWPSTDVRDNISLLGTGVVAFAHQTTGPPCCVVNPIAGVALSTRIRCCWQAPSEGYHHKGRSKSALFGPTRTEN